MIHANQVAQRIERVVAQAPEAERAVFNALYIDGAAPEEVAARLGMNLTQVQAYQASTLRRLRRK
jgi:DNA-directed RNA polymerase specialized sigma24 family protein